MTVRDRPAAAVGELDAVGFVGVAGDAFDYRIIDRDVARAFGKGSEFMSWGKILRVFHFGPLFLGSKSSSFPLCKYLL